MNTPEQIKEARERLGLTQEALAERLLVSRQAVSKWEMGVSAPSVENWKALSEVLGVASPAPETSPHPSGRWRTAACAALALLLLSLAALAGLWITVDQGGFPPRDPAFTGVCLYDGQGRPLETEAGWYFLTPGDRVTVLATFQNGRREGIGGAALYLTPTGTEVYDQREQLAVRSVPDGNGFALFSWIVPADLMGHLDVVLDCGGDRTLTETLNVTTF